MDEHLTLVVHVVAGTLLVFGGWSLYRGGIRLIGFLIGAAIGLAMAYTVLILLAGAHPSIRPYVPWVTLGFAVLLGLLNARLFLKFYYVVVFIVGAVYGVALKVNWLNQWPRAVEWVDALGPLGKSPWGEMLAGVALGLLCVVLHKHLIILLTSILGSALIAVSTQIYWLLPLFVILGIVSQLKLLRVFRIRPQSRRKE